MRFVKMEGIGNDFILIHGMDDSAIESLRNRAARLCDRRFGIGADGIVFVLPPKSPQADFRMRIINSDAGEAEMCGNGIRCFHRYCLDEALTARQSLTIETNAGLKHTVFDGAMVRVDMGRPVLDAASIPTTQQSGQVVMHPLVIDNRIFLVTAVSMGNPHAVIFTDELSDDLVLNFGAQIERHTFFPRHVNVEFVVVQSRDEFRMRVFERGCGETLACGTGTCAAAVAGIVTGRLGATVKAHLPGGDLTIEWAGNVDNPVFMTGAATRVFCGEIA
jgi:diaminopimelate epimerase